jgi:hypothetical protein
MSEFHVTVIQLGKVGKHPNADNLSITSIHGGYPCIINSGDFKEGDVPQCKCCKTDILEFLSIDHINGGGIQHRKLIGGNGAGFYRWLIKNNFPEGFRVLCMNCNHALGRCGYCPHHGLE